MLPFKKCIKPFLSSYGLTIVNIDPSVTHWDDEVEGTGMMR
ncbi:hypothetical protein [Wolbachia endosymbiont of Cardiocondyla obscurior]|nr:hypothetical protein [Wolbachia endosymbiont of Cardiocondyla obscurior]